MLNFEVLQVDEFGVIAARQGFSLGAFVDGPGIGKGVGMGSTLVSGIRATSYIAVDCPSEKMGR